MIYSPSLNLFNFSILKNYLQNRLKEASITESSQLIRRYSNYTNEIMLENLVLIHKDSEVVQTFLKIHLSTIKRITNELNLELSVKYNSEIEELKRSIEELKLLVNKPCNNCNGTCK
jgi:hypothetical protein